MRTKLLYLWKKFWVLTPLDRAILLQVMIMVPIFALNIRIFGIKRSYNFLRKISFKKKKAFDEKKFLAQMLRWIRWVKKKGPYKGNCLSRSLVFWWLAYKKQVEVELKIGARKNKGKFEAHAWIEYQGETITGKRAPQKYFVFKKSLNAMLEN